VTSAFHPARVRSPRESAYVAQTLAQKKRAGKREKSFSPHFTGENGYDVQRGAALRSIMTKEKKETTPALSDGVERGDPSLSPREGRKMTLGKQ